MPNSQGPARKGNGGKAPKSILKKSSAKQAEDPMAARNRELAMHHALLIQHQKDIEASILESIEALIDYPKRTTDAANPDATDVREVKHHLSLFRPTDLDSAVEERNIDERCGYMLCPNARRKQTTSAKFRVVRAQNMRVVKKQDLEKWCSDECGKRALYLRVQLSDTPAWERAATRDGGLRLLGESEATQYEQREEVDELTQDLRKLALERGDAVNSFRSKALDIQLRERPDDMIAEPTAPHESNAGSSMQIEGFTTGTAGDRMRNALDMDILNDADDMLDTI